MQSPPQERNLDFLPSFETILKGLHREPSSEYLHNVVKIAAVLVTYNRLPLLQQALTCLRLQTRLPEAIYLIDNSSTDGTDVWAQAQTDLIYIRQPNSGGAGGFFTGLKIACEADYDWVWCMDDDSLPEPTALAALIQSEPFHQRTTGYLASRVFWTDGTPHRMNQPIYKAETKEDLSSAIPLQASSFVSCLVAKRVVEHLGLPYREMVIWSDDIEYTSRITRHWDAYEIPASRVVHATKENSSPDFAQALASQPLKLKFGLRNRTFVLLHEPSTLRRKLRLLYFSFKEAMRLGLTQHSPFLLLRLLYWTLSGLWFRPTLEFPQKR
jgi:GT2 family glycosyltransferase